MSAMRRDWLPPQQDKARPTLSPPVIRLLARLAAQPIEQQQHTVKDLAAAITASGWSQWWLWARYWQGLPTLPSVRRNTQVQHLVRQVMLLLGSEPWPEQTARYLMDGLSYLIAETQIAPATEGVLTQWLRQQGRVAQTPMDGARHGASWADVPEEWLKGQIAIFANPQSHQLPAAALSTLPAAVLGITSAEDWKTAVRQALRLPTPDADPSQTPAAPSDAACAPTGASQLITAIGDGFSANALASRTDWPLEVQQWLLETDAGTWVSCVGRGPQVPTAHLCHLLARTDVSSISIWRDAKRLAFNQDGQVDRAVATTAAQVLSSWIISSTPPDTDPSDATGTRPGLPRLSYEIHQRLLYWLDVPEFVAALPRPAVARVLATAESKDLRIQLTAALARLTTAPRADGTSPRGRPRR